MKEMVGGCCVCSDERGWPDNPLVYCDGNGCTVAVHQACYGIVTVPTGPWYCRKCESPENKGKVRCELCPSRSGALKKADTGGWAHVVCALYIPEVRFGNVTSMEPIVLRLIPPERFTRTCYICTENGKSHRAGQGACMACNKSGCKQQFHVTCAQSLGLLCEEAGNYLDNVKYCGYCQHHYAKLFTNHEVTVIAKKKGGNVKTIPPYKPVAHDSQSSGSSSEKEGGASPMAAGSGTPTAHAKGSKGPGRKSSQNKDSSKSSNASKTAPATTAQPMDKKKSPSRRQSSTGEGGSSSKTSTPAPSPSHNPDLGQPSKLSSGGAGPSRATPPSASPNASKSPQSGGVISSVASASAAVSSAPATTPTSVGVTTSVVQAPPTKQSVTFQESVITNTDAVETKHTKKRKAAAAAASAAAEQAAQANANESALPVEPETKVAKKRKAVLDTQPACSPKPDKETLNTNKPISSIANIELKQAKKKKAVKASRPTKPKKVGKKTPPLVNESALCALDLEMKHNKKRKAAAAAAAVAESPTPANSPRPTSSPMNVERETPPILSATPPLEAQELETKQTKKRKAAAAAAAERETPPIASDLSASPSPVAEIETKHTKKRKAAAAASAAAEKSVLTPLSFASEPQPGPSGAQWEHAPLNDTPIAMDTSDKSVKKVKTDSSTPPPAHFLNTPPPLPPPPPPPPMRSPRHLTSPLPGPSGMHPPLMNPPSNIRSPSQHQGARVKRNRNTSLSLLVSVPLSSTSFGRRFAAQLQTTTEMPAPPSPHVFHQPSKPAAMDSGIPAHSPHGHSQRTTWGGLNVTYEMQQDPNKPSVSGIAGSSKDHSTIPMPSMPPAMRNKKRAAMAAVSMANQPPLPPPQSAIQMASTSTHSLANVRRHPHPQMPPQQMYQETLKDSPPVSPNTERQLKAKADQQYYSKLLSAAPHMLGNELNPDSGAATRLQEQLNAELAAHAVGGPGPDPIVLPPLFNKAVPGTSGRSTGAQSLDQLLERQWEQGSQFLMEQAQHFDNETNKFTFKRRHVADADVAQLYLHAEHKRTSAPQSEPPRCSREPGPPRAPPPRAQDDRHADRHAERQLSHQLVMREVQQKPS